MYHSVFEGLVYALDPADGTLYWQWSSDAGAAVDGGVLAEDGAVVVVTRPTYGPDGNDEPDPTAAQLVVLDSVSGQERWRVPFVSDDGARRTLAGNSVLVWHRGGSLIAYDTTDGGVLWQMDDVVPDARRVRLTVHEEVVLVVGRGFGSRVEAFELDSGERRWSRVVGGTELTSASVHGGLVMVGATAGGGLRSSDDGRLTAIDLRTGERLWSARFRDAVQAPPVSVPGGFLVASSDQPIHC